MVVKAMKQAVTDNKLQEHTTKAIEKINDCNDVIKDWCQVHGLLPKEYDDKIKTELAIRMRWEQA